MGKAYPSRDLLCKYNLEQPFGQILKTLRCGNIQGFKQALIEQREFFMKHEVLLLMETKINFWLFRNFFKKLYLLTGKETGRLFLKTCLPFTGDLNLDELECIAANLIAEGFIRGYISHEKSCLVLSKLNAFPIS